MPQAGPRRTHWQGPRLRGLAPLAQQLPAVLALLAPLPALVRLLVQHQMLALVLALQAQAPVAALAAPAMRLAHRHADDGQHCCCWPLPAAALPPL